MAGLGKVILCAGMAIVVAAAPVEAQTCPQKFSLRDLYRLASSGDESVKALQAEDAILVHLKNLAKIYACQGSINYFASKTGLPSSIVKEVLIESSTSLEEQFGNKIHSRICGSIRYDGTTRQSQVVFERPASRLDALTRSFGENIAFWLSKAPSAEDKAFNRLTSAIDDAFMTSRGKIATLVNTAIGPYLPSGRNYPHPSTEYFSANFHEYRKISLNHVSAFITEQKWSQTDASRFIDSRGCAWSLPDVSPPDAGLLPNYPGAFAAYQEFAAFLDRELAR